MKYETIIRGGETWDFGSMTRIRRDIYIQDGRIASTPAEREAQEADNVIDATGKLVLPGLIDEHTHLHYQGNYMGSNADILCIPNGVTTAVDAGTTGSSNFEMFYTGNILRYTTQVLAYLHVSPYGMMCGVRHEESHDPEEFQEYRILDLFERYPKTLRGLKIRMCKSTLGDYGIAPLQRAVAIANKVEQTGRKCLVAVHYHDLPDNVRLEELLETLRPGDILAHLYQTFGQTIFTPDGKVLPAVRRARERGVIFDSANGRPHWSFSHLQRAFADGFYPDIISSDVLRFSEYGPHGCSLLHAMCVLSAAGMDEGAICRAVTQTPAHVLGVAERAGTLTPGTPADVCILDAMDSDLVFTDQHGGSRQADKMFVPLLTMREGKIAYRQIFYNL